LSPPSVPCCRETLSSTEGNEFGFNLHDDGVTYTRSQVASIVQMLEDGNNQVKRICTCDVLLGSMTSPKILHVLTQFNQNLSLE
jgi:hypothetical protein